MRATRVEMHEQDAYCEQGDRRDHSHGFPWSAVHPKFRLMTWQLMGIAVAACSLQFFTADPFDVKGASLRRPASTVIKFDPATRQTTSSKRGYPNPMAPFLGGYRCPRRWALPSDQNSAVSAHPTRSLYY